ncbi:YibE/F family protein [Liquorilactobacillus sicerae]|uniref:YibE/F family protein n=1 Tax=Liquorilactobacillus sicerae TaxID=1416943 RepID=UPI00248188BE|nr:YibE/F family protein [Liquorilactobacillus sicerae]
MDKIKKFLFPICLFIGGGLLIFFLARNDAFLYQQPIVRIIKVENSQPQKTTDEYGNHDQQVNQKLTGKTLNGKYRGQIFHFKNTFTKSHGEDQQFTAGQDVFVNYYRQHKKSKPTVTIINYKRDVYLFLLVWLLLAALFLVMKLTGIKAIISVAINFVLFLILVQLDITWNITNFFWIFAAGAVLFTAISLLIVIGFNQQSLVTFIAVSSATALALGLSYLVTQLTHDSGMHYEALDFATQQPKQLFLASTLIGLLGTVMDASTDIVSTLFELKQSQPKIAFKQLFLSGRQVGRSIMGPLINVLLLIFFTETFALATLYFRTGNSIGYTFEWTMSLGFVQAIISGIGITLTIPMASLLAAWRLEWMNK